MENMELIDSVDNICIDMEKAKLLVDEIRTGYLTGVPILGYDEKQRKEFMFDLFMDFNRNSTFLDMLWDYLVNIDNGLGVLRDVIQEGGQE